MHLKAFFLFFFCFFFLLFSFKSYFYLNSLLYIWLTKKLWLGFSVKQIIDSLSFLFLLTHIGLNFNLKMCVNNWANNENLHIPRFWKNWINQAKKNVLKIIPYFTSASYIYIYSIEFLILLHYPFLSFMTVPLDGFQCQQSADESKLLLVNQYWNVYVYRFNKITSL